MTADERRKVIAAAALRIFARKGYHRAGTAEIAAAAGCSEALLYRHFSSKHELLVGVLHEGANTVTERLYDAVTDAEDPFAELCSRWAQLAADEDYRDVLRVRAQAGTMADDPDLRRALRGIRENFRAILREALEISRDRGHIRPELDIEALGRLYSGLTFAAAFSTVVEGPSEIDRLARAAQTLVAAVRPLDP
ncbi:MAG: TetR/AcrR family transcriptional regulator [Thermoleophilia bacterium]